MKPYHHWPALRDLAVAVNAGEKTARSQVERALSLAQKELLGSAICPSFVSLHGDLALAMADELDSKIARGEQGGDLSGIPFAVKDNIDWANLITSAGSPKAYSKRAVKTASVLQGLIDRGAIPIGKTNMNEWAVGLTGENAHFGDVFNPHLNGCLSGGSSSGSSRAVGMGIVPMALGSDTGGSIRIPAAWCGIVGLRPSMQSFVLDGVVPRSRTLDVVGPLVNTLDDCEYFLGNSFLPKSKPIARAELADSLRIGWDPKMLNGAQPAVRDAFKQFMEHAKKNQKITLIEQEWPSFTDAIGHAMIVLQKEFFDDFQMLCGDAETFADRLGKTVIDELRHSVRLTKEQLNHALSELKRFGQFFQSSLNSVDILALPLTNCPPVFQRDLPEAAKPLRELSLAMGAAGLPILGMPLIKGDFSPGSLAGIQLVGRQYQEHQLISMVKTYLDAPI